MSTKDQMRRILLENQGDFVSGEDLAQRLKISRSAIWKAVDGLRKDGLTIDAVTKRGYRLCSSIEALKEEKIRSQLIDPIKDKPLYILETIDSTNSYASSLDDRKNLPNFSTILSEEQSKGRGRRGKSFDSPRGTGIYMSILLKDTEDPGLNLDLLTIRACVALYLAIKDISPRKLSIKWVNDLYLDNKKIAGILTEASFKGGGLSRLIVGIGLNVFTQADSFDANIQTHADSLFPQKKQRSDIVASILNSFYQCLYKTSDKEILSIYKDHNLVLGKTVHFTLQDIEYQGIAQDINEKGNLVVKVGEEEFVLASGEVSIKGPW